MAWRGDFDEQLDGVLPMSITLKGEDFVLGDTSGEDDNASSLSVSDGDSDEDTEEEDEEEDEFTAWNYPRRRNPRRRASVATEASVMATIRLAEQVEELRRLRYELQSLHLSRSLNSDRRDRLLTTALEYFDTFRVGFLSPRLPDIMQYLSSRIDHDVFSYGAGSSHGTNTLIEQWQRYTRMLPSISIRVRSTNCTNFIDPMDYEHLEASASDPSITTCMIETHGTLSGLISNYALRTILPHLQHRLDLTHKLLNKELKCPISLRFYFNGRGHVTRLDFHADFFNAFGAVPGVGLVDLVQILDQAMIGENCMLPEVVEVEEDGGEVDESKFSE